ncbi:MAG TPA: phosphate-starvation-inducible PsiE family protein [Hyalangium sp.]|nr:phosphate-starvation-inducible PsiE family protein [Hyalangium sp.]
MAPPSEPTPSIRPPSEERVSKILKVFEHTVVLVLMGLLMVVVALTTLELGWLVARDLRTVNGLLLDVDEMFELFGFFLLVLIGMELLVTLKAFLYDKIIHVEVVLEVSLIAAAQKIIVLNTSQLGAANLLSLAVLILALAAAFWVVRTARRKPATRAR